MNDDDNEKILDFSFFLSLFQKVFYFSDFSCFSLVVKTDKIFLVRQVDCLLFVYITDIPSYLDDQSF